MLFGYDTFAFVILKICLKKLICFNFFLNVWERSRCKIDWGGELGLGGG